MSIFQNILAKAEKEGKIKPGMIPWDQEVTAEKDGAGEELVEKKQIVAGNPLEKLSVSEDILKDCRSILINLRTETGKSSGEVVGLASPYAGHGTTWLAMVLSCLAANDEDQNVLLIDAQVTHPNAHKTFSIENESGFCDVWQSREDIKESLVRFADLPMALLTNGNIDQFQPTIAQRNAFKTQLHTLKKNYDYIFLDLPPVLENGNGLFLSQLCDKLILVAEAEKIKDADILKCREAVENVGVPFLGVVFNRRKA